MATWERIRQEISGLARLDAHDVVRRQKIDAVRQLTGRHLVIYASDFTTFNPIKAQVAGNQMIISLSDKDGFDEVTRRLGGGALDVLLHSPGGSAEATESIVDMLRTRFDQLRFIIPNAAKSAATMMAMAGDQLLLDEASELGPTDPQMILVRDGQPIAAPA
jgi:ClpP class serine protease